MPKYKVGDIIYTHNRMDDKTYVLITKIDEQHYYYQFLSNPAAARSQIENVDSNIDLSLWA